MSELVNPDDQLLNPVQPNDVHVPGKDLDKNAVPRTGIFFIPQDAPPTKAIVPDSNFTGKTLGDDPSLSKMRDDLLVTETNAQPVDDENAYPPPAGKLEPGAYTTDKADEDTPAIEKPEVAKTDPVTSKK